MEELEAELIAFCEQKLSKVICPKSMDFAGGLPRHPTGKLYKKQLRDSYWGDQKNRLLIQKTKRKSVIGVSL